MANLSGRRLGKKPKVPSRESKPSAHAPAPHARHDRSMARSRSVGRPIFEKCFPLAPTPASNVHSLQGCCRAGIACFYNGFAVDMEWTWHPNARFTLQKYGFREFMILSSLKNRLRSRTHVTTVVDQVRSGHTSAYVYPLSHCACHVYRY